MIRGFLKKLSRYLALGILLLPFSVGKELPVKPVNHNGQKSAGAKGDMDLDSGEPKILDLKHVFTDQLNREYLNYIVNNTQNQAELGIHPGDRNRLLLASQTNSVISSVFADQALSDILRLFRSELNGSDVKEYLEQYPLLVGEDIDHYLESVRKGSWGTTVMSVDRKGEVHFESISLASFLLAKEPQTSAENLQLLVQEEFFQAHQYDAVVGGLYNSGYLTQVAQIKSPEALVKEISIGHLRAFLELFPQQKYLTDRQLSKNSYNFYIGRQLFTGPAASTATVDATYTGLVDFIATQLGIQTVPTDFLDPTKVARINDAFRRKYLTSYLKQGVAASDVQIWNTVGMKRINRANPQYSLDLPALLDLPDKYQSN